jgi:hypothetical protein
VGMEDGFFSTTIRLQIPVLTCWNPKLTIERPNFNFGRAGGRCIG